MNINFTILTGKREVLAMTSVIATVSFVLCSVSLFDTFCLVSSFDVLFSRKNVIYDTILSLGFVFIYICVLD